MLLVVPYGIAFVLLGVAGEILSGDRFHRFFDLTYPLKRGRGLNDERIKTRLSRLTLLGGVVLIASQLFINLVSVMT